MSFKNKILKENPTKSFFYQVGITTTDQIWSRPSFEKVQRFFKYLYENTDLFEKYTLTLMGATTWDFSTTWDVDIALQSDTYDHETIENDIHIVNDTSLNKFRLLSDTQWIQEPFEALRYSELCDNNFLKIRPAILKPAYIVKRMNGEETVLNKIKNSRKKDRVGKYCLYYPKGERECPEKILTRLKNTVGEQEERNFNIKDFIEYDEEHFNRIKNKYKQN